MGAEDSVNLGNRPPILDHMLQNVIADDYVEGMILEVQVRDVSLN